MTTTPRTRQTPRVEDNALVRGAGHFMDDPRLPNTAYASFVRSPHAHARIVAVKTDEARKAKKVLAVLERAGYEGGKCRDRLATPAGAGSRWRQDDHAVPSIARRRQGHACRRSRRNGGRRDRSSRAGRGRPGAVDYEELTAVIDARRCEERRHPALRRSARQSLRRLAGLADPDDRTSVMSTRASQGAARCESACCQPAHGGGVDGDRAAPPASTTRRMTVTRSTPARRAPARCATRPPPSWACQSRSCASSRTMSAAPSA